MKLGEMLGRDVVNTVAIRVDGKSLGQYMTEAEQPSEPKKDKKESVTNVLRLCEAVRRGLL